MSAIKSNSIKTVKKTSMHDQYYALVTTVPFFSMNA